MTPIEAEQVETIARPAAEVWRALTSFKGAAMPAVVTESSTRPEPTAPAGTVTVGVQRIQFSDTVVLEQQPIERDDARMRVRMQMTAVAGLPFSSYVSTFHIEPAGPTSCQVTIRCTAEPTSDPAIVRAMLRDLLRLSLDALKARMEHRPEAAS